jgi:hypothetical protein
VSAEVHKTFQGTYIYNLLALDILETGERIVLEGLLFCFIHRMLMALSSL